MARVLILVLVEDGLGGASKPATDAIKTTVLILVLVEDGLGVIHNIIIMLALLVLILVLVEDGLGEFLHE